LKVFRQINHHKNAQGEFSNKKDGERAQQQQELAWTGPSEGIAHLGFTRRWQGFRAAALCWAMHRGDRWNVLSQMTSA